jgi:hypothetical protein
VSHAKLDPDRRTDPGKLFPWDSFRELVLAPTPVVPARAPMVVDPIQVIDPNGQQIDCDPHLSDGVIVVEPRALIEKLGFRVEYIDGPPTTMRILRGPNGKRR